MKNLLLIKLFLLFFTFLTVKSNFALTVKKENGLLTSVAIDDFLVSKDGVLAFKICLVGTETLSNNETVEIISVSNSTVVEGANLVFDVTVGISAIDETYSFDITDVTTIGLDYETPVFSNGATYDAVTGTITVPVGVINFTVTIPTTEDNLTETDEILTITIDGVSNTGTIEDDDVDTITTETAVEGANLVHTVIMNGISTTVETYPFTITDDTALAGLDYQNENTIFFSDGVTYNIVVNTVTVPANVDVFTIIVITIEDVIGEFTENYDIEIGTDPATAEGIIIDNDPQDTDGDGVLDTTETVDGTDLNDPCDYIVANVTLPNTAGVDCDGDAVLDVDEMIDGTDPFDLCDYNPLSQTIANVSTEWLAADCDGDGVTNGNELNPPGGGNPTDSNDLCSFNIFDQDITAVSGDYLIADCDGDGVTNGQEALDGTDSNDNCDLILASITLNVVNYCDTIDNDGDGVLNV